LLVTDLALLTILLSLASVLFSKLTLLDKVLFTDFCQVGTKDNFLLVFRTAFAIFCEIPDWGWLEGQRNTGLRFSHVHIFVLGSKQHHFDSLCLGCMAIILSFSAAVVGASSQVLLYSIYSDLHLAFLRNSLLGWRLNICVKFSLVGQVN